MRLRAPLVAVLVAGVLIGALATWLLCNAGHCGFEIAEETSSDQRAEGTIQPTVPVPGEWGSMVPRPDPVMTATPVPQPTPAATLTPSSSETPPPTAEPSPGVAIIGASTQDEYQADDQRGAEYIEHTFNWVEILARERGVNLGRWGSWGEPRRDGYEFNWARSGATTMAMIFHGQHEGVAQQVRDGSVSYVMLQIGLNDLNHEDFGLEIYQGVISGEPLQLLLDDMVKNITTAVDEISSAGECQIIVTGMQDYITYRMLPEFELLSDPEGQARVIAAIEYVNDGLRELGEERDNVHYFDFNPVFLEEISERLVEDDGRVLIVGDQRIDLEAKGNAPHFAFLDDDSGHPGTVLSGIFANLYIDKMNEAFDMDLQPLSDEELLEIAGIR